MLFAECPVIFIDSIAMNNKEFITELARRTDSTAKDTQQTVERPTEVMADILDEGDVITIQGFGNFETKKKMERIIVNPATKQRQLIPPKITVSFKPSAVLKDKIKK